MKKRDKNTLSFPFEIKSIGENESGEMSVRGLASTFGNIDLYGDVIVPGAFKKTLQEKGAGKVKFLYQHNAYEPIGFIKSLTESEDGLEMEAIFLKGVQRAEESYLLAKAGALDSFSIGFRTIKSTKGEDNLRYISEIDLWEVSLVTFPANPKALVDGVKASQAQEFIEDKLGLSADEAKRALEILTSDPERTKQALSLGTKSEEEEDQADKPTEEAEEAAKQVLHSLRELTNNLNQEKE